MGVFFEYYLYIQKTRRSVFVVEMASYDSLGCAIDEGVQEDHAKASVFDLPDNIGPKLD